MDVLDVTVRAGEAVIVIGASWLAIRFRLEALRAKDKLRDAKDELRQTFGEQFKALTDDLADLRKNIERLSVASMERRIAFLEREAHRCRNMFREILMEPIIDRAKGDEIMERVDNYIAKFHGTL